MSEQEWMADQVEVSITGFMTTHHYLETAAGTLGELTIPGFRKGSLFRGADGRELVAEQTSWWKSEHELREGQHILATAWPRGFWQREIAVAFASQQYALQPAGFWARSWHLVDRMGVALLKIEPRGIFHRGAYLTILGEIPLELLVFAYYLIHKRWQAESAAATAAAAG